MAMRTPLFDLEEGSHHVMIQNYSNMSDDVSHLSDPTGLETTPPRSSLKRHNIASTTRPSRIRNPWHYLKRVVQRNPGSSIQQYQQQQPPLDERNNVIYSNGGNGGDENDHNENEFESKRSMLQLTAYVEPFKYTNLLLPSSPTEIQQESDPLLIFDVSSRSFSQKYPTNTSHQQKAIVPTLMNTPNQAMAGHWPRTSHPTINSKHDWIAVLILYILLVVSCIIGMLKATRSLTIIVLGIGTTIIGIYCYFLQGLACSTNQRTCDSVHA